MNQIVTCFKWQHIFTWTQTQNDRKRIPEKHTTDAAFRVYFFVFSLTFFRPFVCHSNDLNAMRQRNERSKKTTHSFEKFHFSIFYFIPLFTHVLNIFFILLSLHLLSTIDIVSMRTKASCRINKFSSFQTLPIADVSWFYVWIVCYVLIVARTWFLSMCNQKCMTNAPCVFKCCSTNEDEIMQRKHQKKIIPSFGVPYQTIPAVLFYIHGASNWME